MVGSDMVGSAHPTDESPPTGESVKEFSMKCCPTMRRLLAGLVTVAILAAVVTLVALSGGSRDPQTLEAADKAMRDWPLFGGTIQRNMVNTVDKGVPTD